MSRQLVIRKLREHHFSDFPTMEVDKALGDLLSFCIGTTWIDTKKMSSVDEWTQIAKALRVHGLKVVEVDNG